MTHGKWQIAALMAVLAASPAMAAGDYPFFSLYNTDLVVAIAFAIFVGILVYYRVPGFLMGYLDNRALEITRDLDEARKLREDAQGLLANYERKQREVQEQADRIVAGARREAEDAAARARQDMELQVTRRLKGAEDQIASAEGAALRSVRDTAIRVAIAAAADVIAKQMKPDEANRLIDDGIAQVESRLH